MPGRGYEQDFLDTLPGLKCPICTDPYDTNHIPLQLECKHIYGSVCLEKWIRSSNQGHNRCPECRTRLFDDGRPTLDEADHAALLTALRQIEGPPEPESTSTTANSVHQHPSIPSAHPSIELSLRLDNGFIRDTPTNALSAYAYELLTTLNNHAPLQFWRNLWDTAHSTTHEIRSAADLTSQPHRAIFLRKLQHAMYHATFLEMPIFTEYYHYTSRCPSSFSAMTLTAPLLHLFTLLMQLMPCFPPGFTLIRSRYSPDLLTRLTKRLDGEALSWSHFERAARHAVGRCASANDVAFLQLYTRMLLEISFSRVEHGAWAWVGEATAGFTGRSGRMRELLKRPERAVLVKPGMSWSGYFSELVNLRGDGGVVVDLWRCAEIS